MNVAVTGAGGLTGGAVVRELAARGHATVAIVRRSVPVPSASRIVTADVTDARSFQAALLGVDCLVHVAGIHLGECLVAAPALRDLRRVVAVSSAGIYSSHRASVALYARNEAALRAARPDVLFVRPTMIYGSIRDRNVHRVMAFARRWRFLPVPADGSALVQPIHYADLAGGLAVLVDGSADGVIDAGGGAALSLADAALTILETLGLPRRLVRVPFGSARAVASVVDLVCGTRWRERVERTLEDRVVDNARFVAEAAHAPRDFPTGVRDMAREMA